MTTLTHKESWVLDYLKSSKKIAISHLDIDMVDSYIEYFNVPFSPNIHRAKKCRDLNKTLLIMHKKDLLHRFRVDTYDVVKLGFPKWYYAYSLEKINEP